MNKLLLKVLQGEDVADVVEQSKTIAPLSTPILLTKGALLYDPPTPGRAFRNCLNCFMWVTTKLCTIHKKAQEILDDDICGYYIYGTPIPKWIDHPGIRAVLPEHSGLENVQGGTACINCKHYAGAKTGKMGICKIMDPVDNKVDSMGCSAGWEPLEKEDET